MKKNKGMSAGSVAAISAGAAALGSAAYYFLGPKGKAHQKSAQKWAEEAKKKVGQEIQKGKKLSENLYGKVVDDVLKSKIGKGVTAGEAIVFAKALKKNWKQVAVSAKKDLKSEVSKAKTGAKKTAKRMVAKAKRRVKK